MVTIDGAITLDESDCQVQAGETGTGFLNGATLTVNGIHTDDDACAPAPNTSMTKELFGDPVVEGRKRGEAAARADRLSWVTGDAMALPFADDSFDRYTISFGIRNVTRIPDALAEAFRVLRPGGRLMVLEFSQLPVPAMQWAYDRYSFNVIPALGQMVANDRDSYQYLVESIRRFPDQDTFAGLIRDAGFERVQYRNLSMGIAALHSGWKL